MCQSAARLHCISNISPGFLEQTACSWLERVHVKRGVLMLCQAGAMVSLRLHVHGL